MWNKGILRNVKELVALQELTEESVRMRSNANIPLSEEELLILLEIIRGADGL